MPRIKLARRWGSNPAGKSVDVSESRAAFLKGIGWTDDSPVMNEEGVAPGGDGPDPVISGDPTRRRMTVPKPERDEDVNRAAPGKNVPPTLRPMSPATSGGPVSEGGEDSARGEVSSSHETVETSTRTQTGRKRKTATPESS